MAVSGEIAVRELSGIIRVLQYEMNNAMSVHPTAKVVCEVNSDFRLHTLADRKKLIHIERKDSNGNIFTGYIKDASLKEIRHRLFILELLLIGNSIELDQKKRYCSYQKVAAKHADIVKKVAKRVPGTSCRCQLAKDEEIHKPLIQYDETDWTFMKRVASRLHEPVFSNEEALLPEICIGRGSGINTKRKIEGRCISEGVDDRYFQLGTVAETDGKQGYYYYKIRSRENYCLGETVRYRDADYCISRKQAGLEQEELYYVYTLAKDPYMQVQTEYNEMFTGMSVLGTIQKVSGETMEIALKLRDDTDKPVYYAYDWRPEVGNLMYCMPKVGTTVSLYFPSHDEKEAYAVNCVRKIAAEKESMFQEKDKTFLTEKGKLMALAPSAVHMCSMSEQSESYAQMSLVDTMQENAAVEDIVEKMGIMFAGNQNITLAASDILLDSLYVDLFAGGNIQIMTGDAGAGQKADTSMVLAAAYFSLTATGKVVFVLNANASEQQFCLIMDEPEIAEADQRALLGNLFLGAIIVVGVAALCMVALPIALGALGMAATTASAVGMGAAVGAAATGAFAVKEQYQKDKERGEASSIWDTVKNVGIKSVAGAIEGGLTTFLGGEMLAFKGGSLLVKQTLKNAGKNLLVNEFGAVFTSTGNVLAGALTGDGITTDEIIDTYCEGATGAVFSTVMDFGWDFSMKKIPAVKKIKDKVVKKLETKKAGNMVLDYKSYEKYAKKDVRLTNEIDVNSDKLEKLRKGMPELEEAITKAENTLAKKQNTLEKIGQREKNLYNRKQKKNVQKMIGKAEHSLKVLKERQKNHTNMIKELEEKTFDDIVERGKNRWGTFGICSTMKYCEDRLMDAVNSTPLANGMKNQSERIIKQIVTE